MKYDIGILLSPAVPIRDLIIKPGSVSSRDVNGRGLILKASNVLDL